MKKLITFLTLGLLLIAGQVSADISTGLIGHWPLNRNWMQDADTFSDLSASGNNGTRVNAVAGEESTAFDGTGDWITFTDSGLNAVGATSITVAAWVYVDPVDFDAALVCLIDSAALNVPSNSGFNVNLEDRGTAQPIKGVFATLDTVTNDVAIRSNDDVIPTAGWYHIILTYTASTGKVYVNGSDETASSAPGSGNFIPNTDSMYFGAANNGGNPSTGNLSDVRIYSRYFTQADAEELYALGRPEMPVATLRGVSISGVTVN